MSRDIITARRHMAIPPCLTRSGASLVRSPLSSDLFHAVLRDLSAQESRTWNPQLLVATNGSAAFEP